MSLQGFVQSNSASIGLLFLRVMMGLGSAHHGYQKLFTGRIESFAEGVAKMGFPAPLYFAWAAALSEFVGGILVVVGVKTRLAAAFIFITMSVAVFRAHADDPLKVKELALAYGTVSGALVCLGAGKFSVDRQ